MAMFIFSSDRKQLPKGIPAAKIRVMSQSSTKASKRPALPQHSSPLRDPVVVPLSVAALGDIQRI
jgi:hypothetical protein